MRALSKGKQLRVTMASLLCVAMLSACSGGGGGGTAKPGDQPGKAGETGNSNLKPVELIWYYPMNKMQQDQKTIEEEVNKITKAKLNATVKMGPIDIGSYEQKMNTMVAANEPMDIIWTSHWNFKMDQNVAKGAFLQLDELIDKYAPKLKKSRPESVWNFSKIDGKTYAVLSYQTVTERSGFLVQKRYADKYGLNPADIKNPFDMESFFAKLKAGEKDVIPYGISRLGATGGMLNPILEGVTSGVSIYRGDKSLKLVPTYETPEYKDLLPKLHDWFKKGYINQDAATLKSITELQITGKVAAIFHNVLKPGREGEERVTMGGNDVIALYTSGVTLPAINLSSAMGISRNSKNPDRAMMFLELLNSDKELFNLISYGIEGKHYSKVDADHVKSIANGGYAPNQSWVFGNVFNSYLQEGQPSGTWEETQKLNESAVPSVLTGFVFNLDPVKTEIANMKAVEDEYLPSLSTGTVDPAQKYNEFIDKYKKAGQPKVMAEVQKQLDAWKAKQVK
ncbi:ABC transporter substrate-binding protein [Paenibacillus radicis (ex Xue et al. 2023)]|uniref:ABC transporter substrate-binding protein n=1 Tax=Paenibacillus radicis (ex Xue et al. 2023) TaxID=2972489 RepID=A0ABT1YAV6_9BACL|nr:ABC transporter substrate-binding protein [Paenibacillus radicis (ex Xue et al. 2023)]MCR8630323.1 ABC transporter substrate-binding protein [Paenibacillus radicis (ex Xue et al. 2023)]